MRGRYTSRLDNLRYAAGGAGSVFGDVVAQINKACDDFIIAVLPPADSGLYVGFPHHT